jgi:hypothetical protein
MAEGSLKWKSKGDPAIMFPPEFAWNAQRIYNTLTDIELGGAEGHYR